MYSEVRIPFNEIVLSLETILAGSGFDTSKANLCATLFAKASLDGVASHGLNRFQEFLDMIKESYIDISATPVRCGKFGFFERWDGQLGPGNLNAYYSMERAIKLAKENGIGCIALRNTNHWMRGGSYGWQAVEEDCIGICFTNTKPNMPVWGGNEAILGNNPLVVAIPRKKGPLVLDMALTQFSYGKMSNYLRNNKMMPYDAGFDQDGNLTKDPSKVLENELGLPVGLWKGSGLSLLTDVLVSVLSEGNATHQVGQLKREYSISQFFLCFYLPELGIAEYPDTKIDEIIKNLKSSAVFEGKEARYPGENTLKVRNKNLMQGVPVDKEIWSNILKY